MSPKGGNYFKNNTPKGRERGTCFPGGELCQKNISPKEGIVSEHFRQGGDFFKNIPPPERKYFKNIPPRREKYCKNIPPQGGRIIVRTFPSRSNYFPSNPLQWVELFQNFSGGCFFLKQVPPRGGIILRTFPLKGRNYFKNIARREKLY